MQKESKIITISSGKGGVGKTSVSVNLGILLAQQGFKTCLFDADANLANINIMLNLVPEYTLEQVINGEKTLSEITLHKAGLDIIPGYSGISDFITLNATQRQGLMTSLRQMKTKYDYLIIDNPAGISKNVLSYIKFSHHNIIVITGEPTSLTDAFSLLRVAYKNTGQNVFQVLVNHVKTKQLADQVFKRFSAAVDKYIGCQVNYLGHIVSDDLLTSSIYLQNPVVLKYPSSDSASCFNSVLKNLNSLPVNNPVIKPDLTEKNVLPVQQPDFTSQTTPIKPDIEPAFSNVQQLLTPEALKIKLTDYIENETVSQDLLDRLFNQLNGSYIKRFGYSAIKTDADFTDTGSNEDLDVQSFLENTLSTLHNMHQDQLNSSLQINSVYSAQEVTEKILTNEAISRLNDLLQKKNSLPSKTKFKRLYNPPAAEDLSDSIYYASLAGRH